jgi:hypothetical protein
MEKKIKYPAKTVDRVLGRIFHTGYPLRWPTKLAPGLYVAEG